MMSHPSTSCNTQPFVVYRTKVEQARQRGQELLRLGASGLQIATAIAESIEQLLLQIIQDQFQQLPEPRQKLLVQNCSILVIGGSGRGLMAPYSDVDLLFLYRNQVNEEFAAFVGDVVRNCWDAGLKLGHSLRTISDSVKMARTEPEFATAMIEARAIWGDEHLAEQLIRSFYRHVILFRRRVFFEQCVEARWQERKQHGGAVMQLEPDIKRSPGGLRDIHLLRWTGFARYGTANLDMLRLDGRINSRDVRTLKNARDYLLKVRIQLHYEAGRQQDLFTKDTQLWMAEQRQIEGTNGQRPVELLMQEYFRHSKAVAEITERFIKAHRPQPLLSCIYDFLMTHRSDSILKIAPDHLDVIPRYRAQVCNSLEDILKLFDTASLYGISIAPDLLDAIRESALTLNPTVSNRSIDLFRAILDRSTNLGATLRTMSETGILNLLIPYMKHAYCLLQFNQYHSYTVDEHTFRAIEAAETFHHDDSSLGSSYRHIEKKDILNLAILLHDIGKGYGEDHCKMGAMIASETSIRLGLKEEEQKLLVFLVFEHLNMAHLAFRRDISDPDILFAFSQKVGSPEKLRMLYVLTAADITAVGPGVFTDWKSELLADLYERTMLLLGGKHSRYNRDQRLSRVKQQVRSYLNLPILHDHEEEQEESWFTELFNSFSPHYLLVTPPERIAADIEILQNLPSDQIVVEGEFEPETATVNYHVIASALYSQSCFHRMVSVFTSRRMEIISAQITTSASGGVVDSFRVIDHDYASEVPRSRVQAIETEIRKAVIGESDAKTMFLNNRRFQESASLSGEFDLGRVEIDNQSSRRCTIIDVIAHDRTGLLYIVSRAISRMGLSVVMAKISTHLDQVVDVFYVIDEHERKIEDGDRLQEVKEQLERTLHDFELEGYKRYQRV
ncbi:MAG: [protein-PII] uridylyltransferase [Gimesia sp.]|jgi:[protein-PII] uridylyltransferase|uniref:Bifunctional uridylyltransferase/uridylyl-removing enzyme n=2 Tax=Gimesia maris TaxID=122 RepID=A0A3D3RA56_9PLAN|nr:[protein-PII] uridylyltransferase [Gimesia sp.]HCO25486.1 [protein-PII] uridylyltransferase [Gimesia maris]|tara:strand:- start:10308 stop:13007 length:2700 start_codon:yes stop_codon:yes gene_type:complete